jgi:hypothetical protein
VFRSRIRKLGDAAAGDPVIVAALSSATVARLLGRLDAMCGDIPPREHYHRAISGGFFSAGLQQSSADGASRHWISHPPKGWSGGDWVRAVHLRTANLPTVGIPSNPVELRRCRGGCGAEETVCHILQACPIAHDSRVYRHNSVARSRPSVGRMGGRFWRSPMCGIRTAHRISRTWWFFAPPPMPSSSVQLDPGVASQENGV